MIKFSEIQFKLCVTQSSSLCPCGLQDHTNFRTVLVIQYYFVKRTKMTLPRSSLVFKAVFATMFLQSSKYLHMNRLIISQFFKFILMPEASQILISYSILLIVLVLEVHSSEPVETVFIVENDQVKRVGEEVELNCRIKNPDNRSLFWMKINRNNPSEQFVVAVNTIPTSKDRFSVDYYRDSSTYTLRVSSSDNKFTMYFHRYCIHFIFQRSDLWKQTTLDSTSAKL